MRNFRFNTFTSIAVISSVLGAGVLALTTFVSTPATETARPWREGASTHRDPANLLSMDHALVQADFIGEVRVDRIYESDDKKTVHVEVTALDTWFDRLAPREHMTIGIAADAWGFFRNTITTDRRLIAFVSGGPWTRSSFTYDQKSVFAIADDNTLRCESGNPLFGVSNNGFHCSIQEYMATPPLTVAEMKLDVKASRARAVARLPELALRLDAQPRIMIETPYQPEATR